MMKRGPDFDAKNSACVRESNLRDRVLGEVEKSFIPLPDKGGHNRLLPRKLCGPRWKDLERSFTAKWFKGGLLITSGCVQGLHPFSLVSVNLSMSFSSVSTSV